ARKRNAATPAAMRRRMRGMALMLRSSGVRICAAIVASMMDTPAAPLRAAFDRTLRLSRYVARVAAARPEVVGELEARRAAPWTRVEMRAALAGEPAALAQRLRRLRERVMVTLAHRDLNGLATLDEVFDTMSALAEECIRAAEREAHRSVAALHGEPANGARLVVAALGKLGGGELNVSSDVDLVFLYPAEGETTGERPLAHSAFFAAHARPWERYAWLKARVVVGPAEGVRERVEPFVYRRYLDYGMLASMRELHARIFEAAIRRRKADDIKVGTGGIREVEFAAQLFQMVRGGRDAGLRTPSTRAALAAIGERGLVAPERAGALLEAYAFLRRLEHRLQYYDDQQTQALPRTPEHRALVAEAMDCADWDALLVRLDAHRAKVQDAFNALFEAPPEHARAASLASWLYDPQASADPEGLAGDLAEAGVADAQAVARRLVEFTRSRRYGALSTAIRARTEQLLPLVVAALAREGGREATAARLLDLLEAIGGREAYYSLLVEQPQVLARAARLVSKSAWAARLLARHPILLDELTHTAASFTATDWAAERASLRAECAAMEGDVERLLDHLRHYKQRQMLRFTIADLEGELAVMALSDELSALADTILDVTLAEAMKSVGIAPSPSGQGRGEDRASGFCIVGYGKLGGKELGYASDLDVVFLYDASMAGEAERLARVAQRVNNWMTTPTSAGVLYEIDLRLRPDGIKGLMVSSIAAFRDYETKRAWTWEHQALTRARACAGDTALGARFEAVRDEILAVPRERAKLFEEIVAMRRRMRAEQKSQAHDLKHVEGGVIDLEFCVQALVLAYGPGHPRLRENKGNHTLLHRCAELGLVEAGIASPAADAYLAMRRRLHRAGLNDEETVRVGEGELEPERAAVTRLWKSLFG